MADLLGQQLGNYHLKSLLGRGGFAEVYLGEHIFLKTQAAIKVLLTQLSDRDMEDFLQESRTIAKLNHPHIVRVLEFGVDENVPFLVMDLAPNGTVRQRHAKNSRLEPSLVASYVKQIAEGLQYAHEHKVIHRDVKPENLLLGARDEVLVGDFGIALLAQSSRYQSTQNVVGTVAYMSPEQIQGKARSASDQYSLGVVVYEWLTGERPFYGSFAKLCAQHMYAPPSPLSQKVPGISPVLEQVVMTALAKDPAKRFATIQTFASAFELASQGRELPQEIMSTWVNALVPSPSSSLLSTTLLPDQSSAIDQDSQVDSPVQAVSSGFAGTLKRPVANNVLSSTQAASIEVGPSKDTLAPTLPASASVSEKFTATVIPDSIPLTLPMVPPEQRRKRLSMAMLISIVLTLTIILVSGVTLWTHMASVSNNLATSITLEQTTTPNSFKVVTTGTGGISGVTLPSPTVYTGILPPGTTQPPSTAILTINPSNLSSSSGNCSQNSDETFTCDVVVGENSQGNLSWSASGNIGGSINPSSGQLTPSQQQQSVTISSIPCQNGTFSFIGQKSNIINVPWSCSTTPTPTSTPTSTSAPPTPTSTPTPTSVPPTPTSTPTSTPLPTISANPTSFSDGCVSCTVTLTSSGSQSNLHWTAGSSLSGVTFNPSSGSISAGQSVQVVVTPNQTCPASGSFSFSGPANTATVSWSCSGSNLTVGPTSFSPKGCSSDNNGNWLCILTLTSDPNNQGSLNWTASISGGKGITLSQYSGTLYPSQAVQIIATIPQSNCSGSGQFSFTGPSNVATTTWNC